MNAREFYSQKLHLLLNAVRLLDELEDLEANDADSSDEEELSFYTQTKEELESLADAVHAMVSMHDGKKA